MRETGRLSGKSMVQRIKHISVCSWLHHSFSLSLDSSLSQPVHEIRKDCRNKTQMLIQDSKRCRRALSKGEGEVVKDNCKTGRKNKRIHTTECICIEEWSTSVGTEKESCAVKTWNLRLHFQPLLLISSTKLGSPQISFSKGRVIKIILLALVAALGIIGVMFLTLWFSCGF